jgi:hypothetical protein
MDRTLRLSERFGLRIHLFLCRRCRRDGVQFRRLRQARRRLPRTDADLSSAGLSPEARERIRKILEESQE